MSDYITQYRFPHPSSLMHINQMPKDCLHLLISQLPFKDQHQAGNVCRLWRIVRDGVFRTKKCLSIEIGITTATDLGFYGRSDRSLPSNDEHQSIDYQIFKLTDERIAILAATFPGITQLSISTTNELLFADASYQVAYLLAQYRAQLITLKLKSKGPFKSTNDPDLASFLFDLLNAMYNLKQLSLHWQDSHTEANYFPFSLSTSKMTDYFNKNHLKLQPLLRRSHLKRLDFNCPLMSSFFFKLWLPIIEQRSTPLEIIFTGDVMVLYNRTSSSNNLLMPEIYHASSAPPPHRSITPKVASMFTAFTAFNCNLLQVQHITTDYPNLTHLSLDDTASSNLFYTSDVPALMQFLAKLKHLTTLSIITTFVDPLTAQPVGHHLPQLPNVKKWHLTLCPELHSTYSHLHLITWTTNLSWYFPALEDFTIRFSSDYTGCTDCSFTIQTEPKLICDCSEIIEEYLKVKKAQVEACLRQQLRHIKQQQQQCPNLSQINISYCTDISYYIHRYRVDVKCTLEEEIID